MNLTLGNGLGQGGNFYLQAGNGLSAASGGNLYMISGSAAAGGHERA